MTQGDYVMKPFIPTPRLAMLALAAITTISIFAVACGDDDDNGDNGGTPTPVSTQPPARTTQPAADTPEATQPPNSGVTTIVTRDAGNLGTILTTSDGYTLYTFDNDVAGSGASACNAGCAANWPPLPVSNPTASSDVNGELGTITRDDGSPQVTYNGKPLYLFSGDAAAGDTNGDGVAGIWHVAAP
jgi:predicted lipoprotein with Yx(FWY)xxD motif